MRAIGLAVATILVLVGMAAAIMFAAIAAAHAARPMLVFAPMALAGLAWPSIWLVAAWARWSRHESAVGAVAWALLGVLAAFMVPPLLANP